VGVKMSVKSFVCEKSFTNCDSRDFHDSMHMSNNEPSGFGYKIKDGKCIPSTLYEDEN